MKKKHEPRKLYTVEIKVCGGCLDGTRAGHCTVKGCAFHTAPR